MSQRADDGTEQPPRAPLRVSPPKSRTPARHNRTRRAIVAALVAASVAAAVAIPAALGVMDHGATSDTTTTTAEPH